MLCSPEEGNCCGGTVGRERKGARQGGWESGGRGGRVGTAGGGGSGAGGRGPVGGAQRLEHGI